MNLFHWRLFSSSFAPVPFPTVLASLQPFSSLLSSPPSNLLACQFPDSGIWLLCRPLLMTVVIRMERKSKVSLLGRLTHQYADWKVPAVLPCVIYRASFRSCVISQSVTYQLVPAPGVLCKCRERLSCASISSNAHHDSLCAVSSRALRKHKHTGLMRDLQRNFFSGT